MSDRKDVPAMLRRVNPSTEARRRPSVPRVITRRTLITAAGIAGAGVAAEAQPPLAPVIIGVLTDPTGIGASVSGPPLLHAVQMAVADTGALPDGRAVSIITASYQLKPDDALAIARLWFDQGVSVIVDVPGSAASVAVQTLARSRRCSTLITGSVAPELTAGACSPFGSHWAIDSASITTALARAMARDGAKTWFLVVPDTVLGLAIESDAARAIEAVGGQVVGRSRHPAQVVDFASIVIQVKASGAQVVGLCDMTQGLTDQLGQLQEGGAFDNGRKVVSFLSAITDIHAAGAKAARGLLSVSPFYWTQNDQARAFANRFFATTGQMPDAAHAAAYVAVRHYLRAVIASSSVATAGLATAGPDADQINKEMRRIPVYFFGRTGRLRLDGRLMIDLSLLRVKPPDASRPADPSRPIDTMHDGWDFYEPISIIPASDVYRPTNKMGCSSGL